MLIISKFHDYYDTALGVTGVDKSIVYNRKSEFIEDYDAPRAYFKEYGVGVIYFCGEAHLFLKFGVIENNTTKFIYEYGDDVYDRITGKKAEYKNSWERTYTVDEVDRMVNVKGMNKKYDTPILAIVYKPFIYPNRNVLLKNPCLQKSQFYKVYDPFQTFQKIQQYISNELSLNEDREPLKLSESEKLTTKGMNRMSFKRTHHPRKHKRKK